MKSEQFLAHPLFRDLDRQFARLMERFSGGANPEVALAAALASRRVGDGDICLDLAGLAGKPLADGPAADGPSWMCPELEPWLDQLRAAPVVGAPGEFKPLVLDRRSRLYLHRYWGYESGLAADIRVRAGAEPDPIDEARLKEGLRRLFPPAGPGQVDWQKVAAFAAIRQRFCLISGGPGTGKTRTVVLLLALLLEQAGATGRRIALTAPTGKAASRLRESVQRTVETLNCAPELKAALPADAATIHRLLGAIPGQAGFRHHAAHPLAIDVLVVDEASMVDLALMARLLQATPPSAKIILLGDKDQLASVEAGAVLGDLCQSSAPNSFSTAFCAAYHRLSGETLQPAPPGAAPPALIDCVVQLEKNYRFTEAGGIASLSRAINDGDAGRALRCLRESTTASVGWAPLPPAGRLKSALQEIVLAEFGPAMRLRDPQAALRQQGQFRVLGALRHGPYGIEQLNRLIEEILREANCIEQPDALYPGRPIMITRNDYHLNLFNGDFGVILPDSRTGQLQAFFPGPEESVRMFSPLRLPEHETVYALSVHKSQGSEFQRVLLVLPDRDRPILTRELVYTGLTRASQRAVVWLDETAFRAALGRPVSRTSGLKDALSRTQDAT